jgi:hypothetical protein
MKRQEFDTYIKEHDFAELFNQLGWNNSNQSVPTIAPVEDEKYYLNCVAQRNGFKVYTCEVSAIPLMSVIKSIDKRLRKSSNDYILIFISTEEQMHHEWIVPVKTVDKRVLVPIEYTTVAQLDFLYSKHTDLSFDIEEETTILDVTKKVNSAFELNSEKVTKDFYAGFKKQHNSFADFISGISVESDKQWYVSVMLNRLMFCYFIQKKNFLDFNPNYLREKLEQCKKEKGKDKFFKSFYKSFLIQLFQGGLNSPNHDSAEFKSRFGRIPYLNGGMFDQHQIEKQYADIDIADEAFENLFDFFDKYKWHLDTRIEASGKDINPDVLGYIFEQYINDRAQMGAYYTKEDITNYIGKNCILPFLITDTIRRFGKDVAFIWNFLKKSGDRYIYDSVKKGVELSLPDNIAVGVDTEKPNLLERRKDWNTPTPNEYGLPTEIWRETVERRNRYEELKHKIENGEISNINDFITYNLDITSFVQDFLAQTDDVDFVRCFYESLRNVSILDPTCGSGAFLFAALNILEPLYETCVDRLVSVKEEIKDKYRSNIQYFIYKNIILRNLYGVDIMAEATEIAKLRLFLKMVAVVEADRKLPNLGLDPLPDIDFNIRSGNTLVGYATKDEVLKSFSDMFEKAEWEAKIQKKVDEVSATYKIFKDWQLRQTDSMEDFKTAKRNLQANLSELNEMLNKRLFGTRSDITYEKWLKDYEPFHWFAEFYEIIDEHGGFDVIIGNPPYVEYSEVKKRYSLETYKTIKCGNIYATVFERCLQISYLISKIGMIVQLPIICTDRMQEAQNILKERESWLYTFDDRPGKLFDGLEHIRATIFLTTGSEKNLYSTKYNRWYSENRNILFEQVNLYPVSSLPGTIPKLGCSLASNILKKISSNKQLELYLNGINNGTVYYHNAPQYFTRFTDFVPFFQNAKGEQIQSSHVKSITINNKSNIGVIIAILNSSLFNLFYIFCSNCRDLTTREIVRFPCDVEKIDTPIRNDLNKLSHNLMIDYKKNAFRKECFYKATGKVTYDEYYPKLSKPIIDKIDTLLAKHYGFTQEELDFIINYDIKYRMGSELDGE